MITRKGDGEQYFSLEDLKISRNHYHKQAGLLFYPIPYLIDLNYSMGWKVDHLLWPRNSLQDIGKKVQFAEENICRASKLKSP